MKGQPGVGRHVSEIVEDDEHLDNSAGGVCQRDLHRAFAGHPVAAPRQRHVPLGGK